MGDRILRSMILAAALAVSVPALGQDTAQKTAEGLVHAALADDWSYRFLESLTTDIGPRLAGTEAEARAAKWAEAKLKAAGLEVHTESFPITAWLRGTETASIVSPTPQRLVLTALGGSVATPPDGIEAEIVLFRTYAALLAAPPGSLAGKIAVVTERTVRTVDGMGYGLTNPIRRQGPSEAAKRGAVAYLHRSLGTDSHRLAHAGQVNYDQNVQKIPAAALANPDADLIERLSAEGPVKIHVALTPTGDEKATAITVVGEVKGREKPDEIVLIGAHLDSWDLGTGAVDDGAGDAIVSGVGRLVAALPLHPRRTVRVVLFGAEEMDYSGAAYEKAHAAEVKNIVVAGEADFGAGRAFAMHLPAGAATGPFGRSVGALLPPLGVLLLRDPSQHAGSDLAGLSQDGVPAFGIQQNGLDYFDIHHTADDTFDKVDAAALAQNVAVWAAVTYLAAETDVDFRALAKSAAKP